MRPTLLRLAIVIGVAVVVAGSSLAAYGYVFGFDNPRAIAGPTTASAPTTSTEPSTTTTLAPTTTHPATTTTHPAQAQPAHAQLPDGNYSQGSHGPSVLAYQQRLVGLHFDPGPLDGHFGQDMRYAVEAVEKLYGLPRKGIIGPGERLALSAFQWPKSLAPAKTAEADRVEVDLDKQVLVLYRNWDVRLITTVSTGSGHYFCGGDQGCQYAVTPPGKYHFQWFYNGWRDGPLGHLYKPYYFNGGIAVHGYTSVPTSPASHGCVRIPMDIANYFHTLVSKGEAVYVVGTPSGPLVPPTSIPTAPPTTTTTVPPSVTAATTAPHATTTTHPATTTTHPTTTTTHPVTTTTH
jgi:peptidoglycan hydrolase-like protein with peptidoglycan-binding domain